MVQQIRDFKVSFRASVTIRSKDQHSAIWLRSNLLLRRLRIRWQGWILNYFPSNIIIEQFEKDFGKLVEQEGIFLSELISFVVDSIFYNENFKTGVLIVHQFFGKFSKIFYNSFIVNNARHIEVYQDVKMYQGQGTILVKTGQQLKIVTK